MGGDLDATRMAMVRIALRTCGSASIVGCICVLLLYALRGKEKGTEIGVNMVMVLQFFELIKAIFMTVGPAAVAGGTSSGICMAQATFIEFASLCTIMWTCCLASNLRLLLTRKMKVDALERRLRPQLVLTIVPSIALTCIILGIGEFQNVGFWCWVDDGQRSEFHVFVYFNLWVVLALIFIAVTVILVLQVEPDLETRDGIRSLQLTLIQYMTVFVVTSMFGAIAFFSQAASGRVVFWAALLNSIFSPLPGFLNALVYCGIFEHLWKWSAQSTSSRKSASGTEMHHIFYPPPDLNRSTEWTANSLQLNNPTAERQIFVTTFNMGECTLQDISNIEKWVPKDYDVYAIGVQECLVLPDLREYLLQFLGSDYTMFTHEIGSNNTSLGFHGMIALTVFARTVDVDSGRFCQEHIDEVNQGKKIGTHRLQNKGTVGLSFRYHDTSLAFLTAHLASDSSGKCKVHERDKGANKALKRAVLVTDDIESSVQLQHHHVFFLGDLNYRMTAANPDVVLEKLAGVCALEFAGREDGGRMWREDQRSKFDLSKPRNEEARMTSPTLEQDRIASLWEEFCGMDELGRSLSSEHVFYGFREMAINFPPTYRRSRAEGDGDYSSLDFLSRAFTTRVFKSDDKEVKPSDMVNDTTEFNRVLANEGGTEEKGTPRVPSYTDRILVHSLKDREPGLKLNAYESCECVTGSDHKPVGLWCTLQIAPKVLRPMDPWKIGEVGTSAATERSSFEKKKKRMTALEASNQLQLQVTLKCVSYTLLSPKEAKQNMAKALYKSKGGKNGSRVPSEENEVVIEGSNRPRHNEERETPSERKGRGEGDDENDKEENNLSDSESDDEFSDDDEKMGASDGRVANVQFVLPVPTEDPRLNQRKDNEIFSAFGSKENRAKLARLRRETGTVLDVEYDLANTTKLPWKKFETNGMQITADVRPEFGLHGLFKMVNKTGKTLGSGVLCLRDIMRKKEMQDTTLPTHIEHLPLVVGGQLRGTIELSINCQKLTKMAAEFAAPDANDNLNREQEAF